VGACISANSQLEIRFPITQARRTMRGSFLLARLSSLMTALKKKKLDLKIIPALLPSILGVSVSLLVLGQHIGLLIAALVSGYFSFLIASVLVEVISLLKRKRR